MKSWKIAAAFIFAISGSALPAKKPFLTGAWGGPHAAIAFSGGLAEVRFECASGSIDATVLPAKDGAFAAKGIYRTGESGVRVGRIFVSQPATYSGIVTNGVMTLNVELEDGTLHGPYTLTEGMPPQLARCPA